MRIGKTFWALASVSAICAAIWIAWELQTTDADPTKLESGMTITNEKIKNHPFLQCMYDDKYFPTHLVDKGKQILFRLCEQIETRKPAGEAELYVLTHAATNEFNELSFEFDEAGSEIETVARECIGSEFSFIAAAYGFVNADAEELIGTRDW
jgi:uncharacterized protein DUF5713